MPGRHPLGDSKREVLGARVDPEVKKSIARIARRKKLSVSALVNDVLSRFVARHRK